VFLVGAGAALAGVIIAFFIPRREQPFPDTASMPIVR
jgi:Na+/H+ antiporter NhaA